MKTIYFVYSCMTVSRSKLEVIYLFIKIQCVSKVGSSREKTKRPSSSCGQLKPELKFSLLKSQFF